MSRHKPYRLTRRTTLRRPFSCPNRSSLRGRRRGPDDLQQALAAFGRAIRAHRRLARLAPSFFDPAVIDREAENRAEQRRWMATWQPYIDKAYGVEPGRPVKDDELPRLPSVKVQREVDIKLAEREMCMIAGRAAMDKWRQRQPHAIMSWSRMARLLKIGFDLGKLACGLEIINPLPEKITYDYELTDLKRSYGDEPETPAMDAAAPVSFSSSSFSSSSSTVAMDPPVAPASSSSFSSSSSTVPINPPPVQPRCDAYSRLARAILYIA